jgi:hypothetical protein
MDTNRFEQVLAKQKKNIVLDSLMVAAIVLITAFGLFPLTLAM